METISIINKSGKVVKTTKHLVSIFKDAKEAYQDKKAELRNESNRTISHKQNKKLLHARADAHSEASSSRHSSTRRHRSSSRDLGPSTGPHLYKDLPNRPALTERALSEVSSRHGGSRSGHHKSTSNSSRGPPPAYRHPYLEDAETSRPNLTRRHTESLAGPAGGSVSSRGYAPSNDLALERSFGPPQRSRTSPLAPSTHSRSYSQSSYADEDRNGDQRLAYGSVPPPLPPSPAKRELGSLMSRFNGLMLEAECLQHSATTIIAGLQKNPEAMAAVALTLAEISNLLVKAGPGILTFLKAGSPAAFALLASPQFLIAGGLAVGVTVVMIGGWKIVRKLQADAALKKEGMMDEALPYTGEDGYGSEMGSIETWRRGIADVEAMSVTTSVDGEFITPEAERQRKEAIRERRREERPRSASVSVGETRTHRGDRRASTRAGSIDGSERTVKPERVRRAKTSPSTVEGSVSGRTESTIRPEKSVKAKKPSALTVLFKKSKDKGKDKDERERDSEGKGKGRSGHAQPRILEM